MRRIERQFRVIQVISFLFFPHLFLLLLEALQKIAGVYPTMMRPRTSVVDTNLKIGLVNQDVC